MKKRKQRIDVVDGDGSIILSIEPLKMPSNLTADELAQKLLPGLNEIVSEYESYYVFYYDTEEVIH